MKRKIPIQYWEHIKPNDNRYPGYMRELEHGTYGVQWENGKLYVMVII